MTVAITSLTPPVHKIIALFKHIINLLWEIEFALPRLCFEQPLEQCYPVLPACGVLLSSCCHWEYLVCS